MPDRNLPFLIALSAFVALALGTLLVPTSDAGDPAVLLGLPRPSTAPSCGAAVSGLHSDSKGCVYSCSNGTRRVLAGSAVGGTSCDFSTPTPTATVTPTPTVTATP